MKLLPLLSMAISTLVPLAAARAGVDGKSPAQTALERPLASWDSLAIGAEYTGTSDFKNNRGADERGRGNDETSTWHEALSYVHRIPLARQDWFATVGLQASRFDFQSNASVAPNTLQSYALPFGLEYRPGGGKVRAFFIETAPGVYFSRDLSAKAFDLPTIAVGSVPLGSSGAYLLFGASFSMLRERPVLPLLGMLWNVNERLSVRAFLPQPQIAYRLTETLQIWGGGELAGGSFISDSQRSGHDGSNERQARVNRTPVTYSELRAGAGLEYTGWSLMKVQFAAGYAFQRKFDYWRAGITQETEGAPYVKLAAELSF